MGKKLSEMSLEELWQLFPIFLTEHRDEWEEWYEQEKAFLEQILPPDSKIYPIGSTSVDSIWAKPIIDILVEVPAAEDWSEWTNRLLNPGGYLCMSREENRISFNKGYTEQGFAQKVFHLHLRRFGDNDELYFRDYLREHPDVAREYERMKLQLWKKYEHDRDGYTNAKTDFVKKYTLRAKQIYPGRYQ